METFNLPNSQLTENLETQKQFWEDSFLNWFSGLNIPMIESKLKLGGLEYFHFSSLVSNHSSKKIISGFGSHQDRKLAAIKCAAETLERIEMLEYFSKNKAIIPQRLQTSSGWAVHKSKQAACDKALSESIERHLLLKSFFIHKWSGFKLIQKIEADDMTLFLTLGKYTYNNQVSILVAAHSKKFQGVSFGYGLGNLDQINDSTFWTAAIFEAVDKILLSEESKDSEPLKDNWIRQEIFNQLHSPFDFSVLKQNLEKDFHANESELISVEYVTVDISEKMNLDFPLYAAYAKSDGLIPLFSKKHINAEALAYLSPILEKNKIFDLPESHPIL